MTNPSTKLSGAVAILALATGLTAQVVITEIHPSASWIEIQNRSATTAQLATWSVYCTTPASARPGTYWWAFPNGTALAPGAFLRVHWYQGYQPPTSTEIWTGDGHHNFLFGLGGERLAMPAGSVALLSSQLGDDMGSSSIFVDWVTWGAAERPREHYAVAAGRWLFRTFVPSPTRTMESIALSTNPSSEPTPPSEFFIDATPTPGRANQEGSATSHFGHDCAVGTANAPTLEVRGIPAIGNPDFAIRAHGTGRPGQTLVFLMGFGRGQGAVLPLAEFTCPFWIDLAMPVLVVAMPTTPGLPFTDFLLPLDTMTPNSAGWTVYVQALLGRLPFTPFDHAASAGVEITFGG